MAFVTILCSGCGAAQTELTQEENDMVAEYMAGLLLKYDLKYDAKLVYAAQVQDVEEETNKTNQPPTKSPDTVNKEAKDPEVSAAPKPIYQSISDIYKEYGVKVSYFGVKEYNSYPETLDDGYFLQEANKDNKLLVLSFEIKNTKKTKNNFCMINEGITYRLMNKEGKTNKPMLTALVNDLQYLDIVIGVDKKEEAVLVFQVPKNQDLSGYALYITKGDMTAEVKLK